MVSLLLGGLGALSILSKLVSEDGSNSALFTEIAAIPFGVGVSLLVFCVGLYSFSMAQIRVTKGGRIPEKTIAQWEQALEPELSKLETRHMLASWLFMIAVVFFAAAVLVPFF
ncbi:hypothetical protein Q4605_03960 [Shimia thalassica]|nr:hypothetical protein [Shimia thalassica]